MKTLYLALFVGLFWGPLAVIHAQGIMSFTKERHEFGQIPEGPKASHTFEFTNTGDAPLRISSVRASCGCTTPHWSKEPVAPGETGTVQAVYNTEARKGHFQKSITIRSDAKNNTHVLHIAGDVVDQPDYTAEQLANSPRLELQRQELSIGKVELGQATTIDLNIRNAGKTPLKIKSLRSDCNCVRYQLQASSVAAGATEILTLEVVPNKLGQFSERVLLYSNDRHEHKKVLRLKGKAVESLQPQSPLRQGGAGVPFK